MISKRRYFIILSICIGVCGIIAGIAFLGYYQHDIMHYIATSHRFYKGDAFFVDDWSPEQTEAFLLLPFVALYYGIVHSTEGIVLYFRLLYHIFKILTVVYGCHRLYKSKKFGWIAYLGILGYGVFCPYNIDTLSYNTIPLMTLFVIIITLITTDNSRSDYILCGIMMGIEVIAHPFCIIVAGALFILLLIERQKKKERDNGFVLFATGVIAVGVLFLLYVLSKASFTDIISNLKYIVGEPDHNIANQSVIGTILGKLIDVARGFFSHCYPVVNTINLLNTFLIIVFKKYRQKALVPATTILFFSLVIEFLMNNFALVNVSTIPVGFFCINLYFILSDTRKYTAYIILVIIQCFSILMGTNMAIQSAAYSLILMLPLGFFMLDEAMEYTNQMKYKVVNALGVGTLIVVIAIRVSIIWEDGNTLSEYKYQLQRGPYKGLWMTQEEFDRFNIRLDLYDSFDIHSDDKLFVAEPEPMAYLYLDVEYATFGTPFFYLDYDRLKDYYSLHPKKMPTVVFFPHVTDDVKNGWLWEKIVEEGHIQELECGGVVAYLR